MSYLQASIEKVLGRLGRSSASNSGMTDTGATVDPLLQNLVQVASDQTIEQDSPSTQNLESERDNTERDTTVSKLAHSTIMESNASTLMPTLKRKRVNAVATR